jgi:7,8-dihydroneopterin aldolase/epimerase/oxygenase
VPSDDLDAITLSGMSFHTLIGVLPHEREHPQPLEIDLTAWVHPGGAVVDYRRLYAEVRDALESPALYLEELADAIAVRILDEFSVERVRIAVRKPHAAVGGPLVYAEVAVVRERDA